MAGRPMSVKEIAERAGFGWNPQIPLKYWLRAADTIYQEIQAYLGEGNDAQSYLLLLRYSELVLNHLRNHPDVGEVDVDTKKLLRRAKGRMPTVMDQLTLAKTRLDDAYNEWYKINAAQRNRPTEPLSPEQKYDTNNVALSWNPVSQANILDAGQNQDLAIDLAQKELRRRRRQAGISDEEEQRRRDAGVWENWDNAGKFDEEQELRREMDDARRQLDKSDGSRLDDAGDVDDHLRGPNGPNRRYSQPAFQPLSSSPSTPYSYPSIHRSLPLSYRSERRPGDRERMSLQPPRPPKESLSQDRPIHPEYRHPPRVPGKEPVLDVLSWQGSRSDAGPTRAAEIAESPVPRKRVTFKPASYLENGEPIRPVFLPRTLRHKFLEIAMPNTRRGLETCGLLCGTPVNNALFITSLLIPEQINSTDTCDTVNEDVMLQYCMENDLIQIGWIHTHPTQTCFMSSRDLHTQSGYQVMMAESIAIVCAPRHQPSWGIFRLTNPPGLQHILTCTSGGTFHQHSIDNIYTTAENPPGHVYEAPNLEFSVMDLRPTRKETVC